MVVCCVGSTDYSYVVEQSPLVEDSVQLLMTVCIDSIVSCVLSLDWRRSQSSTYEKPRRLKSDLDRHEQKLTLVPLLLSISNIIELRMLQT